MKGTDLANIGKNDNVLEKPKKSNYQIFWGNFVLL